MTPYFKALCTPTPLPVNYGYGHPQTYSSFCVQLPQWALERVDLAFNPFNGRGGGRLWSALLANSFEAS